tara:strand:+ start:1516 stop:1656 length:141 start_codon:yes stop_codon:yes gene_type:complete
VSLTASELRELAALPVVALLAVAVTMGPSVRDATEAAARELLRRRL